MFFMVCMPRRILHMDLDAFFVSVEQALDPSLRGKPVVVGGDPGGREVVASASYEARAFGVRSGMSLGEARRRCPQAIFVHGRYERYQTASERFMDILSEYTPHIESGGIDEAYMDMSGFEPLYGPVAGVAAEIRRRIRETLNITASVGISSCKVVSKVASDHCKPDGLLEIPPGQEKEFLAPLPVGDLMGVGPKTEAVLVKELGIHTIGELAVLPESILKRRFGVMGEVLHRWANGMGEGSVSQHAPAKSMSRETTFAEDVADRRVLLATLRYLAERVGAQLRGEEKRARRVTLKLRYLDFQTISRHRTLRVPTDLDGAIFEAGGYLLDKSLAERRDRVRLIGIGVGELVDGGVQLSMLDGSAERLAGLSRAVDSIRDRYGFLSVQTGLTLGLRDVFSMEKGDYLLKTPSLSR